MESTGHGVFEAVRQIAQERARKLERIREELQKGETETALLLTRELVGLKNPAPSLVR